MEKFILELNKGVANFSVLYMKLHNFHWNLTGERFLELHEYYEELYGDINEELDELAEQILMIGGTPVSTLKEQLEIATLKEAPASEANNGLTHVQHDLTVMLDYFKNTLSLAEELDVIIVADLMTQLIVKYSKKLWIVNALLKK